MRLLLISANQEWIPDPIFPLGPAYVAAAARRAGHQVTVVDLCFERHPWRHLAGEVARVRPHAVALALRNVDNAAYPRTTDYLAHHLRAARAVRQATQVPLILGGSAFSIAPAAYLDALGAEWGVVGEGESSLTDLLACLEAGRDPAAVHGVVGRDGGAAGAPARWAPHWWEGGPPARDLFPYRRYLRRGGMGNVQTKRGCPFHCRYCTYPLLEGSRFRARPAGDVVDEMEQLQRDYGPHPLFFVDAIFNLPTGHLEAVCEELLRRRLAIRWSCYATPVGLGRAQAHLMARAGCEGVELGTDALEEGQLDHLGKSFDVDQAVSASRACTGAGLKVCHTVIFGGPGETEATARATVAGLRASGATAVVAMVGIRVYPGTPLARELAAAGRLPEVGLAPTFYVEEGVTSFLIPFLCGQAAEAGNWVLPGVVPPLLPASQRLLRAAGVSGPLWRLLRSRLFRAASRFKYRRPVTSAGVPTPRRLIP